MPDSVSILICLQINGSNEKRMEALKLYQEAFRAVKISGDVPSDDIPPDELLPDEIEAHIIMEINGLQFGIFPGDCPDSSGNVTCQLEFSHEDDFRRAYNALVLEAREHSSIEMPFWCKMHASVKDKFGIFWSLCIPG